MTIAVVAMIGEEAVSVAVADMIGEIAFREIKGALNREAMGALNAVVHAKSICIAISEGPTIGSN